MSSESASFSINLTIPPVVIKEYFDGRARVATARRPVQNSHTADILGLLAPFLLQFIQKYLETTNPTTSLSLTENIDCSDCSESSDLVKDIFKMVITKLEQSDHKKEQSDHKKDEKKNEKEKKEEAEPLIDCFENILKKEKKEQKEEKKKKEKDELSDDDIQDIINEVKNRGSHPRVSYLDSDDIKAGKDNLKEMMKMFGPLIEEFTTGLNTNLPKNPNSNTNNSAESGNTTM
jgi:Glu-tRNA(Gln) amidotransferase subunit E-like FAD-binding protein